MSALASWCARTGGRTANFTGARTAATYPDVRINWRAPIIYYIILDGYARSEVMRELFDFDNTAFLERLERKGFFVARGSNANYCQTPLSRSSSLMI